jgi:sugar-specific transcriptional regulator TrmB
MSSLKKEILISIRKYLLGRKMVREEILQILQQLGLSKYESMTYLALVLYGPSSANDLSRASGVPRSKIYDVLDGLIGKLLVEVFEERPKKFKAISPETVIKSMICKKEQQLKDLKEKASTLPKQLQPLSKVEDIREGVWEQRGEKATEVLDKLAEMIKRAEKYVFDITRDFSFSQALKEAIRASIKRKVKIGVLCMGINEENYHRARWYYEQKIPIKVFEVKAHPRILVVDGKEVSIRLDANPLSRKFRFRSIWSADPSFVAVMDSYMKNLWKMAKPVDFKSYA